MDSSRCVLLRFTHRCGSAADSNRFATISSFMPLLPVFAGGTTKFQLIYVGDPASHVEIISHDELKTSQTTFRLPFFDFNDSQPIRCAILMIATFIPNRRFLAQGSAQR